MRTWVQIPSSHIKSQAWLCVPITPSRVWRGRKRQADPWSLLPATLARSERQVQ